MIKPEILYMSETLDLYRKIVFEHILKDESKFVRKTVYTKLTDEGY